MRISGDWLLLCAMAHVPTRMCEVQDAPHKAPCWQYVVWLVQAKDDAHAPEEYMHTCTETQQMQVVLLSEATSRSTCLIK